MNGDEFQVISGIPHHHDSSVLRPPSPDGAATVTRLVDANGEEDGVGDNNDDDDVTSANDDLFNASGSASTPPSVLPKRCRGCSEPILDRFLLQAMDSFWHTACLRCSTCGAVLGEVGATCYTRAGMVLCRNDYIR
jgi:LIM domain